MIHTVRNPFYCRKNQFAEVGYKDQVLVIGIDKQALMKNNPYRFRIGKNPQVYTGDATVALKISQAWKNPKGKEVMIIPVDFFKKEEITDGDKK
jgi:hypothetical protein